MGYYDSPLSKPEALDFEIDLGMDRLLATNNGICFGQTM
jgi:hypothetical protein